MKYPKLFSPGKIGTLEIRNRVIMTSMGCGMANPDGTPSEQMIAYYTERAKGGVGLICTEVTRVNDDNGVCEAIQLSVSQNKHIAGIRALADSVHRYGARIFIQLHHPGRQTNGFLMYGRQIVAPSPIPCGVMQEQPRELSTDEVRGIVRDYIDGAWRAQQGGADGVELHAGHGYLLNQFLSPHTNKRSDEYGGSFENRARIVTEILTGIKDRCGADFPVSVRVSVDEFVGKDGIQLEEGVRLCKLFEDCGADAMNVTCGIYETMNTLVEPMSYEEGWRLYLVDAVKKELHIPVYGNAVIRHPAYAEELLESGRADFISMGRTHLADPEWCNKAREGREDEIRYCISCLRCFETVLPNSAMGVSFNCSVNARLGCEARYPEPERNGGGRTVAIIGGGPAGMETARVLAERRFKPVIFEAGDKLGGNLNIAKLPPKRAKIGWFVDYLTKEMARLKVDVRLNTVADKAAIDALDPYAVIVATGTEPIVPESIPGIHGENVFLLDDVLTGKVKFSGKRVAVIGSGESGIETADKLAEDGNEVSVVEMQPTLTPDGYWQDVLDIMGRLNEHGVKFYPGHKLVGISKAGVSLEGDTKELCVDAVVLALGLRCNNKLYKELKDSRERVFNVGNSAYVSKMQPAVTDAYQLAYSL